MSFYRGTGIPGTGTAASRPVRLDELAASDGSSLVGFIQSGTGAVATTVQDELRREYWVAQFGATGDGVTNDTAAIAAAVAAINTAGGGILNFDGVYNLGDDTATGAVTKFNITSDNVTLVMSAKTKFLVQNDSAITTVFAIRSSNVRIQGQVRVESNASTPYTTTGIYGAAAVKVLNNGSGNSSNIIIDGINQLRGSGAFFVQNAFTSANRVSGIRIGTVVTIDVTYGINCQNNGDDLEFDWLETDNAYRSYFVYGCKNHKGKGRTKNANSGGTPINITKYSIAEGGSATNTENIDIEMDVIDGSPSTLVAIRHIGDGGATSLIKNINLKLKANSAPTLTLSMLNFNTSGGAATATPFDAKIQDIYVEADTPVPTDAISYSPSSWTTLPNVVWRGSSGMTLAKAYGMLSVISLTMEMLGARFFQNGGTLANAQYLFSLNTSNVQQRMIGVDASNNTLIGQNGTAAVYTIVYGGANGVYFGANGVTVAQVYASGYRPNADNSYNLGTASQRWAGMFSGYANLSVAAPSAAAGTVNIGGTTATTVGAAGGASALPATPLGYLIANVAGTQVKIPYYSN